MRCGPDRDSARMTWYYFGTLPWWTMLAPLLTLAFLAHADEIDDSIEVVAQGEVVEESAATHTVALGELAAVPRVSSSAQLMLAPGVLALNHGGVGHAESFFMRGYDAGEGQNIEMLVDGVPMNEVSNPHGHGYTDLHLVPPELVREVQVTAGSFLPEQGDFAFAGSADLHLGLDEAGTRLSQGMGSWNTARTLLLISPADDPRAFGAFEWMRTDGFGENRAAQRALALGRVPMGAGQDLTLYGYAVRYDQAGAVRADDIADEKIDRLGTYDPAQGGESARLMMTHRLVRALGAGRMTHTAFAELHASRMRNNWTGWLYDPGISGENGEDYAGTQRGDGQELRYEVLRAGARGRYDWSPRSGLALAVGQALRLDHGRTEAVLLRDTTAIPYAAMFDDSFTLTNLAGWGQAETQLAGRLTLRGGARLDTFAFAVRDHLAPTSDRDGTRLSEQTAQSLGFAMSPRGTADLRVGRRAHLLASYGHATRSTEAMALSDNETAPFALARQADLGASWSAGQPGGVLYTALRAGGAYSRIDRDMLFSETEGRNVEIGASTRRVLTASGRAQVLGWLDTLLNVGWAVATLDETGERLPYVPEWVVRLDSAATGRPGRIHGTPLKATGGGGLTWVPPRPLPYGTQGTTFLKLDASAEIALRPLSLSLEVRNLLNRENAATELVYAAQFEGPDAAPQRLAALHQVADEPRTLMLTVTVHLE